MEEKKNLTFIYFLFFKYGFVEYFFFSKEFIFYFKFVQYNYKTIHEHVQEKKIQKSLDSRRLLLLYNNAIIMISIMYQCIIMFSF